MSVRSRVRSILVAGAAALGLAGIIVVGQPSPGNVALDCAPGSGFCVAILEPPPGQCAALHSRVDPGGAPGRVLRALVELEQREALSSWVALPRLVDGGAACHVEVRLSVALLEGPDGGRRVDGQAPAWRDVIDAADLGSIVKDGRVSQRPSYARNVVVMDGGARPCRAHVYAGEDPCADSVTVDPGGDPDAP